MNILERVADAIEQARCPGREGPYGLYDYTTYGDPEPHHVRDFRDTRSESYGHCVFRTTDREAALAEYERLTREHVAKAAVEALREPTAEMAEAARSEVCVWSGDELRDGFREDIWRAMIDEILDSNPGSALPK